MADMCLVAGLIEPSRILCVRHVAPCMMASSTLGTPNMACCRLFAEFNAARNPICQTGYWQHTCVHVFGSW